jgi:glycosylphosphatidylinositol transamidase (GPIT) subunit GPI8/ABC-type branched-subunit amino acid transport system substrate-binding protein
MRSFCVLLLLTCCTDDGPIKIGVLTQPYQRVGLGADTRALEWAVANVNAAGGAAGRPLELLYFDLGADYADFSAFLDDPVPAVRRMLTEGNVAAVIGPLTSDGVMGSADFFIENQVPLVTTAGSAGIMRAFAGKDYVWRVRESDVAQMELLVLEARERGADSVSLLCPFSSYGESFFDWFGFFAAELGMEVKNIERMAMQEALTSEGDPITAKLREFLLAQPGALIIVPESDATFLYIADALGFLNEEEGLRGYRARTSVLFSDGGFWPQYGTLAHKVWSAAPTREEQEYNARFALEGQEGIIASPDPNSGFPAKFADTFDTAAGSDFDASLYDGLLLLAYGLEYSGGLGRDALVQGLKEAVDGRGAPGGWRSQDIERTLQDIRSGNRPDIRGATGDLGFDRNFYTELTHSYFAHWRIEDGEYVFTDYLSTGRATSRAESGKSVFQSYASEAALKIAADGDFAVGDLSNLWVLIAAVSSGWDNYRHQADALSQYQLFRERGVDDDHIIMIGADDIAEDPVGYNPLRGEVRNQPGGPNLYPAVYDYALSELDADGILKVMRGEEVIGGRPVLSETDATSNLYIFIVGHGGDEGVGVGAGDPRGGVAGGHGISFMTPTAFAAAVQAMYDQGHYRRVLVAIEACHSGVMGAELDAPGVLLITAANPYENSRSGGWDPDVQTWVNDQFSIAWFQRMRGFSNLSLRETYSEVYAAVPGSHVSIYNNDKFGDTTRVSLREFVELP